MDQTEQHPIRRRFVSSGIFQTIANPVLVGAVVGLVAVWLFAVIRDSVDFEAIQWWLYVNYDYTGADVNPFTIGPFLAGMVGGYAAGYLTDGYYEDAVRNAVKANLFAGGLFYLSAVAQTARTMVGSGMLGANLLLVVILQPLLFLGIPFTLVFMGEGVIAGPVGHYIRRKLLGGNTWLQESASQPDDSSKAARSAVASTAILVSLTVGLWAVLYAFYLLLSP